MYREVFNTDGKQKSGFSSSKTSNLRSYILKVYTNTLPTFEILHQKWSIYLNDLCPRCTTQQETNDYVWSCSHSAKILQNISDEFRAKYHLPLVLDIHVKAAVRAIPTLELTNHLKNYFHNTHTPGDDLPDPAFTDTTHNKVNKAILATVMEGRDRIWKPRNEAALAMQQLWNISKKDKRPMQHSYTIPHTNLTVTDCQQQPIIIIDNSKLNRSFDS